MRGRRNDPLLDGRLTLDLFQDQQGALLDAEPDLLMAWHGLTTAREGAGFDQVFSAIRGSPRPTGEETIRAIANRLTAVSCVAQARALISDESDLGWPLAYALASIVYIASSIAFLDVAPGRGTGFIRIRLIINVMPPAVIWAAKKCDQVTQYPASHAIQVVSPHGSTSTRCTTPGSTNDPNIRY